jgi:hypothetical protein
MKQMREWEKRDVVDVLKEYHTILNKESKELADSGDSEGSNECDNDALVIEKYLETEHGLEWDGIQFLKIENK